MYIHKHGNKNDPLVIILHPMGITGEKLYEILGSKLGKCFVLSPDMGGHASEKRAFRSSITEAAALHKYLAENDMTNVSLLYGASLGAAVALHLLKYDDLNIGTVYLDGAPVARLNFVMRNTFPPILQWQKNMIAKNREKGISDFVGRYGRDIAEHMADTFLGFDKASIKGIGNACVVGNTPELSENMQKRLWFDWGEKELYTKTSKPLAEKLYPHAHIIVREGFEHWEYIAKENEDYTSFIRSLINDKSEESSV